jgi:xanthine dehydrogenase YagR molybdenum-binding subunit
MSGVGSSVSRLDGPAKVTGAARYAADTPAAGIAYGVFVPATIARGRIATLDASDAERAPGVLRVFAPATFPKLAPIGSPPAGQSFMPLQDDTVRYEGQPIALVVAETLEQAQHAASLVRVTFAADSANVDFTTALETATTGTSFAESDTRTGDAADGLRRADVRVAATYFTADRHHVTMEPSTTVVEWKGDEVFIYDATQWVWGIRAVVAAALEMPAERIHVRAEFTGGGFGSKGYVWPHQLVAVAAARELRRPLELSLSRANTFVAHGYQPASRQELELGATHDGRLTAIRHAATTPTSRFDGYVEYAAISSRHLYACPNIETRHRIVAVDRATPTPMRAPHEGLASFGIESAMDELAYRLRMDPLELRLRNYTDSDPVSGKPFSSKALRECYRVGAERFGWATRPPEPRAMREGRDLVGWGVATAMMETFRFPSKARVSLASRGRILIEAGAQEIGTGVRTIMPQIAADVLDVPIDRVHLVLGDTSLPETAGTFGSSTTIGVGSAVHDAATRLKAHVCDVNGGRFPSEDEADALLARQGVERFTADSEWSSTRIVQRIGLVEKIRALGAESEWKPGPETTMLGEDPRWSMHTWGAVFVEMRVDEDFLIPRLTRAVGVYSAGRIINPKTAASQMTGGMVWGTGQALLEESAMDPVLGRYLSKNLAGYLVPVNLDIPDLHVEFVDEFDAHASPLGARGIGELGATGMAAAIANAVFHATGVRVRRLPIRPESLLRR